MVNTMLEFECAMKGGKTQTEAKEMFKRKRRETWREKDPDVKLGLSLSLGRGQVEEQFVDDLSWVHVLMSTESKEEDFSSVVAATHRRMKDELDPIKVDVTDVKTKVQEIRSEVHELKEHMTAEIKSEVHELKEHMTAVHNLLTTLLDRSK
eukprot:SAG31_NODE_1233_length_9206_cov_32.480290_2_plen_151_part_00